MIRLVVLCRLRISGQFYRFLAGLYGLPGLICQEKDVLR
jgi:hypothetical protein